MNENDLTHGAVHQPLKAYLRRKLHKNVSEFPGGSKPYDWTKSFPRPDIVIFDQGQSDECGLCSSDYGYQKTHPGVIISKKDGYSQVFYLNGGTTTTDLNRLFTAKGVCKDSLIPSYENGNPPSEAYCRERLQTDLTRQDALLQKLPNGVPVSLDIDSVAAAIDAYGWVRITIKGQNNGTWYSQFPTAPSPTVLAPIWEHFVAGMQPFIHPIYGKCIGYPQSWGTKVGDAGWQAFTQAFFDSGSVLEVMAFPVIDTQGFKHAFNQNLFFGMSGDEVLALQKALAINGEFTVRPTAFFGPTTFGCVQAFQRKYGIMPTGFCGIKTRSQLNALFKG